MDTEHIVHIEVNLETSLILYEFEDGHTRSRHKHQSALFSYFLYDVDTRLKKLVLVKGNFILDDAGDINVGVFSIPKTILATSKA